MKAEGVIKEILPIESGISKADKAWSKQAFVIETDAQYNPDICFGLFGDEKMALLNGVNVGDSVVVEANVSSRSFNGKWYHSIDCWRLDKVEGQNDPVAVPEGMESTQAEKDDLPF